MTVDPHLIAEEATKEIEYNFMKRTPDDRDWVEAIERTLERFPVLDALEVEIIENENNDFKELIDEIKNEVGNSKGEVFDKIRMLIQRQTTSG